MYLVDFCRRDMRLTPGGAWSIAGNPGNLSSFHSGIPFWGLDLCVDVAKFFPSRICEMI